MSSSEYESDYENNYTPSISISTQNEDEVFIPIKNQNIFELTKGYRISITDPNDRRRYLYFLGVVHIFVRSGSIQYGQKCIHHNPESARVYTFWQSSAKTLKPIIFKFNEVEIDLIPSINGQAPISPQDFLRPKFSSLFKDPEITNPELNFFSKFQILLPEMLKKYRTFDYEQNQPFIRPIQHILTSESPPTLTVCLGGKNSGKTTFNEMMLETALQLQQRDVTFIDLDPGQQMFGFPGCVSVMKGMNVRNVGVYGDTLAPVDTERLESYVLGSFDCMEYYTKYEDLGIKLLDEVDGLQSDVIVNMPGWLTGLGIQFIEKVVNKVLEKDEFDVKIVFLGDKESFLKQNIAIDVDYFIPNNYAKYYMPGFKNSTMNTGVDFVQMNWTSGDLREYRLLRSLHDYNNNMSILNQQPVAVSMGTEWLNIRSINITQYLDYIPLKKEEMTCYRTLPGSIIAISFFDFDESDDTEVENKSLFKKYTPTNEKMFCLGVVHSIDLQNSYMNLIIPSRYLAYIDTINPLEYKYCKIDTLSVGLPKYEFLPIEEDVIKNFKGQIPYTTDRALKKNEHTWKVRKNIQRRGQQ